MPEIAFFGIDDADAWRSLLSFIAVAGIVYFVALWIGLVLWTYRDVTMRTASQAEQLCAVMLVALFFLGGWLVYVLMRPRYTLEEAEMERLEGEVLAREMSTRQQCPECKRRVTDEFAVCPFCAARLRIPCGECGKLAALNWAACAYCGSFRPLQRERDGRPAAIGGRAPSPRLSARGA
jgi:hypothetical protein